MFNRIKSSGKLVYGINELSNLLGIRKNVLSIYVNRMCKQGLANRIGRKIVFTDNDFVIASQLIEPSYISIHSALYLHKVIQQIPQKIESVNPANTFKIDGYIYYKINPKLFFGYEKKRFAESYVFLATPEKAVLDGIYLSKIPLNILPEIIEYLDKRVLKKTAERMKKTSVRGTKKTYKIIEKWL